MTILKIKKIESFKTLCQENDLDIPPLLINNFWIRHRWRYQTSFRRGSILRKNLYFTSLLSLKIVHLLVWIHAKTVLEQIQQILAGWRNISSHHLKCKISANRHFIFTKEYYSIHVIEMQICAPPYNPLKELNKWQKWRANFYLGRTLIFGNRKTPKSYFHHWWGKGQKC